MAKVRVHHLAKELGLTSTELIEMLRELGEEIKGHSSTIDEETANAVRELIRERRGQPITHAISLPRHPIPLTQLAERFQTDVGTLVRTLMGWGIIIPPHQPLELEIIVRLAKELGYEFTFEKEEAVTTKTGVITAEETKTVIETPKVEEKEEAVEVSIPSEHLQPRPPVVTVMGHVDHGKCLHPRELVLLADGRWIAIQDMFDTNFPIERDGDYERICAKWQVLTFDSQIRQAETQHVWRVWYEGKLIHLKLRNGDTLRVTPEHPLFTSNGWKRADELSVGEYIAVPRRVPVSGSLTRFKELVIRRLTSDENCLFSLNQEAYEVLIQHLALDKSSHPPISSYRLCTNKFLAKEIAPIMRLLNLDASGMYDAIAAFKFSSVNQGCCRREPWLKLLKEEQLPSFFYLLGAMFGGGCSGFERLSNNDEEIVQRVEETLKALGEKVYRFVGSTCQKIVLRDGRNLKQIAVRLFDFPLGQKSKTMTVPEAVQVAPSEFVSRFLQGYFDTDGYVDELQCLIEVASASMDFLRGVKTLLLRWGITSTLREGRYPRLYINGKSNLQRFHDHIGFTVTTKREALESLLASPNRKDMTTDRIPLTFEEVKLLMVPLGMTCSDLRIPYRRKVETGQKGMTLTTWRHFCNIVATYVGSPMHSAKVGGLTGVLNGVNPYRNLALVLEKDRLIAGRTLTELGRKARVGLEAGALPTLPSFEEIAFAEVCEILSETYRGYVYDLTVPDTHNFIVNNIIAHNTTLLDAIRKTNVAAQEFGQITQHIGAYEVEWNGRRIVFIDTPGHEAFTALRARGASVTDIVVLVVAADDGVMPQTVEAINHAKAADVRIIVAINKIDRPDANPDRVKAQLAEHGLIPEEWGGDTICVNISALRGEGIDELLEMILLVADLADLKANPKAPAWGYILENEMDPKRGPTITLIVKQGTLRKRDFVVAGTTYGRIRKMFNWKGKEIEEATPSTPVSILGLEDLPEAGDRLEVVEDGRIAKEKIEQRVEEKKLQRLQPPRRLTLEDFFAKKQEGEVKELNLIVKADVHGSLDAIVYSLERLEHPEVKVSIIHKGIGDVTENDVMLAAASNAIVLGFNVRLDPLGRRALQYEPVDVRLYRIIYELIDDLKKAIAGLLEPILREEILGVAEVLATFRVTKFGIAAGCLVQRGRLMLGARCRVIRKGQVVTTSRIISLRRFTEDRTEIPEGMECGVVLDDFSAYEIGDLLEAFQIVEVQRSVDEIREKPAPALAAAQR